MMPRFTVERVRERLDTSIPTATAVVKALENLGIVAEMTSQKKNRIYSYQAYLELLFRRQIRPISQPSAPAVTT